MSEENAGKHAGTVAAHYNDLDPVFRGVWGEDPHHGLWENGVRSLGEATERMSRFVGQCLELKEGERLLDVGCGYGRMAADLAKQSRAEATGITVSRRQRDQAVGSIEVRLGDWLENGLPDRSFDAVLAVESLEHMVDPGRAVAEISRVLKPGGRLVLGCWMTGDRLRTWERRLLADPIRRDGMLAGMEDESAIRRRLDAAGLEIGRVHDLSRRVEKTWSAAFWRASGLTLGVPELRRLVFSDPHRSRRLAITLNRMWIAYVLGCLRYLVIVGRKP